MTAASSTGSNDELLARILQEVVSLKSKNAQLEQKIDILTEQQQQAAASQSQFSTSPLQRSRQQSSSGGLTPLHHAVGLSSGTIPGIPDSALASSPPSQPLGPSLLSGALPGGLSATSSPKVTQGELPKSPVVKGENGAASSASSAKASESIKGPEAASEYYSSSRVILTTYPNQVGISPLPLHWGAADPAVRGPVLASRQLRSIKHRNAIGSYGGSYMIYRALACATGALDPTHRPDFTNTEPPFDIPAQPEWADPYKICTLDPFGHIAQTAYKKEIEQGLDIRPTLAATKAHIKMPELDDALKLGRLEIDGDVVLKSKHLPGMDPSQDPGCEVNTHKVAIEPVWYLPGVARRLGISEGTLRRALFEETGGMYPELLTRHDLSVFLPPIAGATVYIFGNPAYLYDPSKELTARVHDECNGSDVFGSDICTCRPYLLYGIEEAVRCAQRGGVGLIVYWRKEGRALGETVKYQVYNKRKRSEGGDTAATYFMRTELVAGVKDSRFQPLMSDVLVWLGVKKIDNLISMSDMKYDAIRAAGIQVINRYEIPDSLLPSDAHVEIDAKIQAGYFSNRTVTEADLEKVAGRGWENLHQ